MGERKTHTSPNLIPEVPAPENAKSKRETRITQAHGKCVSGAQAISRYKQSDWSDQILLTLWEKNLKADDVTARNRLSAGLLGRRNG